MEETCSLSEVNQAVEVPESVVAALAATIVEMVAAAAVLWGIVGGCTSG